MQFKLIIFSQTTEKSRVQKNNAKHLNYIKVVNFDYINLQTVWKLCFFKDQVKLIALR